ncbi:NF-X1-type zinc finger protein NFXL1-like [Tubulanus polymorphus]|uniref:NF-X1-type zinc finger protein NFXL1-like n=1 Tax=Tubulanus polymorphus TaxID=672921 RepID=UPI003DA4BA8F
MNGTPAYLPAKGRGRGRGTYNRNGNNDEAYFNPFQRNVGGMGRGGRTNQNNSNQNTAPGREKTSFTDFMAPKRAQDKFQDIKAKDRENAQRLLKQQNSNDDNEDDEEDDSEDEIKNEEAIQTVLKSFADSTDDGDIGKTSEYLHNFFKSDTSVCLICLENIRKTDAIWCCNQCFCVFHIPCIQKWVKDGVYQTKSRLSDENFPDRDIPWNCPNCRLEYKQIECPTKYLCYCGKVEEPEYDPWLLPHSCGQQCGKLLPSNCGHKCMLFCHPGPCPPCPKTVSVKCHCNKQQPQIRRCGSKSWSCGKPCARTLSCKQHRCEQACHEGDCKTCSKTSTQRCQCGQQTAQRPCATPVWQCDKVCGKVLGCGNHICEQTCHAGSCGPCPRAGARSCPCGKSKLHLPCTEDIPTCGDTCGKLLDCGIHTCAQRCHTGPCGACRQMVTKRCKCGARQKEVLCCKDYICDTRCTKTKDCGRHSCKRKCCDGNCPPCEQPCAKNLGCKKHKCNSRCHTGRCYPCSLKETVSCFCKSSKIVVRCGREKITKPPRCSKQCSIASVCNHEFRDAHRCHFGRCPPCRQVCEKSLTCTHSCPARCHIAVFTKVVDKVERSGPWEAAPEIRYELVDQPCPPCQMPVPVTCLGDHETINMPCSEARSYSCSNSCGRKLPCGNHTCAHECHKVQGASDNEKAGKNCLMCEAQCNRKRPIGCKHKCLLTCHPGQCPPCEHRIKTRCHCSSLQLYIECNQWITASESEQNKLKSCMGQCTKHMSCGHFCILSCHDGACSKANECTESVTRHCPCKRKKKNFACVVNQKHQANLDCDAACLKIKEKKQKEASEAERMKKEEEVRKQKEELEKYNRKFHSGPKRKSRSKKEIVEEPSFLTKYKRYIWVLLMVVALIIFSVLILNKT